MGKKYSHEKLRTTTTVQPSTYSKLGDITDSKKYDKPVLKYVRSNKDIIKGTENMMHAPYKKFTEHHQKVETENHAKEEEIPYKPQEMKRESQSAYISVNNSTKVYPERGKISYDAHKESGYTTSVVSPTVGAWKALKTGLTTTTVMSPK